MLVEIAPLILDKYDAAKLHACHEGASSVCLAATMVFVGLCAGWVAEDGAGPSSLKTSPCLVLIHRQSMNFYVSNFFKSGLSVFPGLGAHQSQSLFLRRGQERGRPRGMPCWPLLCWFIWLRKLSRAQYKRRLDLSRLRAVHDGSRCGCRGSIPSQMTSLKSM